ncbi:hypothetical protein GCM10010327_05430 [Streptomyces nitrosporeus]|nr:hypothetical protein GCM10010327_05430 [Streptomyces nitrosporeus]
MYPWLCSASITTHSSHLIWPGSSDTTPHSSTCAARGDGGMSDRFAEHAEELWGRGPRPL